MYKRRDQNSFPVAVVAPKKFSDKREGEERDRRRETGIITGERIMPSSFILPREDKWKTEKIELARRDAERQDE